MHLTKRLHTNVQRINVKNVDHQYINLTYKNKEKNILHLISKMYAEIDMKGAFRPYNKTSLQLTLFAGL